MGYLRAINEYEPVARLHHGTFTAVLQNRHFQSLKQTVLHAETGTFGV